MQVRRTTRWALRAAIAAAAGALLVGAASWAQAGEPDQPQPAPNVPSVENGSPSPVNTYRADGSSWF